MIPLLYDLHPTRMIFDISAGLVVLALHGLFLALAAKALGDSGPQYDGRLTADPTVHVDIFALIAMAVTQFAWLKPMDIRRSEVRGGTFGLVSVVAAALLATFALGRIAMAGRGVVIAVSPPDMLQAAEAWLFTFTRFSDRIALFNLLPLFSLTATHVLRPYLPRQLQLAPVWASVLTLALAVAIKLWIWR